MALPFYNTILDLLPDGGIYDPATGLSAAGVPPALPSAQQVSNTATQTTNQTGGIDTSEIQSQIDATKNTRNKLRDSVNEPGIGPKALASRRAKLAQAEKDLDLLQENKQEIIASEPTEPERTPTDPSDTGGGTGGGGGGGGGGGDVVTTPPSDPRRMMAARDAAKLLAEQYGLGGDFFNQIEGLLYEDISEASLMLALRGTDAYKKRFAANASRVAKGLPALSESEYLRMENLYRQELRAAGLPPEFYDSQDDFRTYIENDLGYNEFVARVGLSKRASQMANPEVKMQLKNLYGVGDNELVAYFLNPQKTTTMLQRQFNVAQTAGALSRAGFGTGMAEDLTTAVVGGRPETTLDYKELEQATETAAAFRPISQQVLGGERGAVTESDLLTGIVAEDVQSQRRLQREQQRRLAEYQGGGGLMESQQGVLGLRSATR
jgi:hypothetical protein